MSTTNTTRTLNLQGLINHRKAAFEAFFLAMYPCVFPNEASITNAEQIWDPAILARLLSGLQDHFFRVENPGMQEISGDAQYIATLLRELRVRANARRVVVKRCWHHGNFDPTPYRAARVDRITPTATKPIRPEPHEVFPKIRAIIACMGAKYADSLANGDAEKELHQLRHDMAVEFVREGICRNLGNALPVVKTITRKERKHVAPVLHSLLKRGLFDRLPHTRYIRPDFAVTYRDTVDTLSQETESEHRVRALLRKRLCWSLPHAKAVVEAFELGTTSVRRAASRGAYRRPYRPCYIHQPGRQAYSGQSAVLVSTALPVA